MSSGARVKERSQARGRGEQVTPPTPPRKLCSGPPRVLMVLRDGPDLDMNPGQFGAPRDGTEGPVRTLIDPLPALMCVKMGSDPQLYYLLYLGRICSHGANYSFCHRCVESSICSFFFAIYVCGIQIWSWRVRSSHDNHSLLSLNIL